MAADAAMSPSSGHRAGSGSLARAPAVALRPASVRDWPLIDRWLAEPDIARWRGSRASAQAAVIAALQAPTGLASVILGDDRPVGYAHALEAVTVLDDASEYGLAGAYRIDVFVGERAARGRGIGVAALRLAVIEVFETTLAPSVFAILSVRNEAAVRAHEKAGFRWVKVVADPLDGPSWLLRKDRPA